jgi:transposase-like protein
MQRGDKKVRVMVVKNIEAKTLQGKIQENVKEGSEVFTDALSSYEGLSPEYHHAVVNHAERYVIGRVHTNSLENFWTLFKRCLNGTYVSVDPRHLERYLDEEAFRFNHHKDDDRGRFVRALKAAPGKRLTYKELTNKGVTVSA